MNYLKLIVIMLIVIYSQSCSVMPHFILYNNTGDMIVINSDKDKFLMEHGQSAELPYPFKSEEWIITAFGNEYRYAIHYPPYLFHKQTFIKRLCFLQLEPDWNMYLLKPDMVMPAKELPTQPQNFPLKSPKNNNSE